MSLINPFGIFGPVQQGPLRTILVLYEAPAYSRGPFDKSWDLVCSYFPEYEQQCMVLRLKLGRTLMGFVDESVARSFFKKLQKIGWGNNPDDLFQVHVTAHGDDKFFYDASSHEYRNVSETAVIPLSDGRVVFREHFDHWGDVEEYFEEYFPDSIPGGAKLLSKLKPKEVNKYVSNQTPELSEQEFLKKYSRG